MPDLLANRLDNHVEVFSTTSIQLYNEAFIFLSSPGLQLFIGVVQRKSQSIYLSLSQFPVTGLQLTF